MNIVLLIFIIISAITNFLIFSLGKLNISQQSTPELVLYRSQKREKRRKAKEIKSSKSDEDAECDH